MGPDGAGKSSVADALAAALVPLHSRVYRYHWRPMMLPRPGALRGTPERDTTRPHDTVPHRRWVSVLLLAYYLLDFWLGHVLWFRRARRRGQVVLVERGWHDMAVDPHRYRLSVSPALVRWLGRWVPGPDVRFILDGDPMLLRARKPELPVAEIDRQRQQWRQFARGRHDTVVVDVGQTLDEVVATIHRHVVAGPCRPRPGWVALPRRRKPRLQVPRHPRAAAIEGLRLYQPTATPARAAAVGMGVLARTGVFRLWPGTDIRPSWLADRLAAHLPPDGTFAVLASNHPDRWVVRLMDRDGRPLGVAKVVGPDGDGAALVAEATALDGLARTLVPPVRAPALLAFEDGVLVIESVVAHARRHPCVLPADVAGALGAWYAGGATGTGGPSHGDCAPWNLLRVTSGWVLVDWEHARRDAPAFQDVLHFLTQGHAMVGRPDRGELLAGLRHGDGWVGGAVRAYAAGAGLRPETALDSLRVYLSTAQDVLRPAGPGGVPEGHAARVALRKALG